MGALGDTGFESSVRWYESRTLLPTEVHRIMTPEVVSNSSQMDVNKASESFSGRRYAKQLMYAPNSPYAGFQTYGNPRGEALHSSLHASTATVAQSYSPPPTYSRSGGYTHSRNSLRLSGEELQPPANIKPINADHHHAHYNTAMPLHLAPAHATANNNWSRVVVSDQ